VNENGQLHVFDKASERVFTASPRGIAAEAGFYDFTDNAGKPHSAERFLGRVEDFVAPVIAGILDKQSLAQLTGEDRVRVALFTALQQQRVRAIRQRTKSLNAGILRVLADRGIDPGNVVPEMDDEDVKRSSIPSLPSAKAAARSIARKAWVLYCAPHGKPFYISDNPFTLHNLMTPRQLLLDSPGIEIYLPISPKFTICFMDRQMIDQIRRAAAFALSVGNGSVDMTPIRNLLLAVDAGVPDVLLAENVDHINSLQARYASRFVMSATHDFELVKAMIAKNQRLKEPPGFVLT
jgi:hypothetical protein